MMEIKRDIMSALVRWKQRPDRKPLIIQGTRQIGKTWVMKKFGEENFKYVAYFNFDASEELCREFENTKNPERLIDILRLYTDCPVEQKLRNTTSLQQDLFLECHSHGGTHSPSAKLISCGCIQLLSVNFFALTHRKCTNTWRV